MSVIEEGRQATASNLARAHPNINVGWSLSGYRVRGIDRVFGTVTQSQLFQGLEIKRKYSTEIHVGYFRM